MTQNRVHLRAEARQLRDGKPVYRGDPFTASPEEAADLVSLNFASVVDHSVDKEEEVAPPTVSRKPKLRKKVISADDDVSTPGRYGRRDLRADE
jgi:hypothetical protein